MAFRVAEKFRVREAIPEKDDVVVRPEVFIAVFSNCVVTNFDRPNGFAQSFEEQLQMPLHQGAASWATRLIVSQRDEY